MENVAVLAITKNGIKIGKELKAHFKNWKVFAPLKFSDSNTEIEWYSNSTSTKIIELFKEYDAIVCIFSLGAVIRLVASHIKDKKTDPAVIVIDDKVKFVISALSGHLGGANKLAEEIAQRFNAIPVITTAADVNKTIAVDLLGKEYDWKIDDESTVTKVSALMVNEEKIGVYQEAGEKEWWKNQLPYNVTIYSSFEDLKRSMPKGFLIITDRQIQDDILKDAVVYRPKTLVVGIGLHWDTTTETIKKELDFCLIKYKLNKKSIAKFATIKKEQNVLGLVELGKEMQIPIEYYEKEELAKIGIPNPSHTVQSFEGTPSVAEAAAIKGSRGKLIVEKQKFPPNLTIAIARIMH